VLTAIALRDGIEPKAFTRKFDFHKAIGKEVTFSREPHKRYNQGAPFSFVDAVRGPNVYKSTEWVAWHGKPVEITVDMEQTEPYSSVTLGMLSNKPSYIFLPEKIAVSVSEDGENFTEVAAQDYGIEAKDAPDNITDLTLSFAETSARFVKVTVTPVQSMPEWHYKPGARTYVFIDEIMVR
jgi:hexosaminidase